MMSGKIEFINWLCINKKVTQHYINYDFNN
jgi:hypothetical protein